MDDRQDDKILKEFGENLKKFRNQMGLSTRELSDLANINLGNLSDLELGKKNPLLTTIYALAQALQVEIGDLLPPIPH